MRSLLFGNPEFKRLVRSKLRPRTKILLTASAVLILGTILALMLWSAQQFNPFRSSTPALLRKFFFTVAGLQFAVISLYGLFLSAQSITLERERHTFEFQRLVAMGPKMLILGKLFGASCEAWWLVLIGTVFSTIPMLWGDVSVGDFLQTQLVVYIYGIVISSIGLLCSSVAEKTSRVTGMAIMLVIIFYNLTGLSALTHSSQSVWGCMNPAVIVFQYISESKINPSSSPIFTFFGQQIPIFAGFLVLNLGLVVLFLAITIRRLTDEEFSFIAPRVALFTFACFLFLVLGDFIGNNSFTAVKQLTYFHAFSMSLLLLLAFGLTPSSELLRCRCHRAARDLHWKIVFEPPNRLQDSTACLPMAICVGLYVLVALVLTLMVNSISGPTLGVIVMVAGMGMAMPALLLYIQAYSERSGYRAGLGLLSISMIFPPILTGFLTNDAEDTIFISPIAYLAAYWDNFRHFSRSSTQALGEAQGIGMIWTLPLICAALAILLTILAAMRIRFMLDLCEMERRRELENAEKPAGEISERKVQIAKVLAALKREEPQSASKMAADAQPVEPPKPSSGSGSET